MKRLAFLLTAWIVVLAACSPGAAPAPPTAAPTDAPTAAPTSTEVGRAQGGTLKLLWWQAPTILNPHLAQGTKDTDASRLVLEPLAAIAPDGSYMPQLAAEIPTVANGGIASDLKTTTWKLKSGVKWSDGTDFTADDVVFTWHYQSDKETAATDAKTVAGIDKVEAKDATTVVITWHDPNPNPLQAFTGALGQIIQKQQFEQYVGANAKDAPGNLKPIGTGPYKVNDFKPGDVVTYQANELYRDASKPFFSDVELKGGGDAASAARAALQTGDVDYAWNLQVEAAVLNQLSQGGKGELASSDSGNVERLLFNFADPNAAGDQRSEPSTQHPFLTDVNVRTALAMAIDRDAIGNQLYGAGVIGVPTCNLLTAPPALVSQNTASFDACQHDPDRASQLLDQAGWARGADGVREKNGVRLHLLFQTTVNPIRQKTQDIVKQNWEQIGVETEVKSVDAGVFFSSDPGNPDTAGHFYADVEMLTNASDQPEPTNWFHDWTTDAITQKSNGWRLNNYERWSNADYDATWQQLKAETDPAKRQALAIKLNDMLVQQVVVVPLVARKFPVAGKSRELQGVNPSPWDGDLWNVADWSRASQP